MSMEEADRIGAASPVQETPEASLGVRMPLRARVSSALGRCWQWIQKHPSWTPGVSTVTGLGCGALYAVVAAVSAVALVGGIIVSAGAALIPDESISRKIKNSSVTWVSACDNFLAISLRLGVRGLISAVPILGNIVIGVADYCNNENQKEEHLLCLLSERKEHTKLQ